MRTKQGQIAGSNANQHDTDAVVTVTPTTITTTKSRWTPCPAYYSATGRESVDQEVVVDAEPFNIHFRHRQPHALGLRGPRRRNVANLGILNRRIRGYPLLRNVDVREDVRKASVSNHGMPASWDSARNTERHEKGDSWRRNRRSHARAPRRRRRAPPRQDRARNQWHIGRSAEIAGARRAQAAGP